MTPKTDFMRRVWAGLPHIAAGIGPRICAAIMLGLMVATAQIALPDQALAAKKAQKRITLAEARKALADGKEAVSGGKPEDGVRLLDIAVASKRLNRKELAQALYYRGLGYRASGKLAQAVSDFTAALWMKNGLSDADRKSALAARAATYQQAGLSAQGQDPALAPAVKKQAPKQLANPGGVTITNPTKPGQAAAAAQSPGAWSTAANPRSGTGATNGGAGSDPLKAVGDNIQSFFGNLFSGGSQASNGATGALPSAAGNGTASVSSWSSASARRMAAPTQTKPRPARGTVRVQVAAMRGQSDATQLAASVTSKHGASLPGGRARVTNRSIGSMGKFYLVEIGPYRTVGETKTICAQLRRDGLDCHVVR